MNDKLNEKSTPGKTRFTLLKTKANQRWLILSLLIFMLLGGVACLGSAIGGAKEKLNVDIHVPSAPVKVGDIFTIEVVLANVGDRNVTVNEILLPKAIAESADLLDFVPTTTDDLDARSQMKFSYDLMIAPNGRETVVFTFQAVDAGETVSQVIVNTASGSISNPLSVVFTADENVVVIEPTTTLSPTSGDVIPFKSVVQITAQIVFDGQKTDGWSGSGTVISEDGLILTNAHVVLSDRFYEVVDLIISITEEQDQPPKRMFYADVLQGDYYLDLAVVKIRSDLNGNPVDFGALGIEPVKIGRAEALKLGDPIFILGYPGIGGETITLTRGEVSGFTSEEPYGNRAYIKTSAVIAGGNSGGLAASPQGEIIGVPTQVGSGGMEGDVVDCRPLADTNRDGVIDERDNCVPTGGFINALRPINLALPLIEAAEAGQVAIIYEPAAYEQYEDYEQDGDVVLFDMFEDNRNNWSLEDYHEGWSDIIDGRLVINVESESTYINAVLPDKYGDLIMAVDAQVLQVAGDGDFGFVCGYVDEWNFSVLEISEDGYYSIWTKVNDDHITIVDWSLSSFIPSSGTYTLAAYCGWDGFALAINETLLVDVDSDYYQPGQVGLFTGTWNQPNIMVGFSDFAILKP